MAGKPLSGSQKTGGVIRPAPVAGVATGLHAPARAGHARNILAVSESFRRAQV